MTAKQTTKVSATVNKSVEMAYKAIDSLVQGIAQSDSGIVQVRAAFVALRKTKVTIGNLKTCGIAQRFRDGLCALNNPITGKPYSEQTASNYLSAFRSAIKNGTDLQLNKSRSESKGKASGQSKTPAKKTKETKTAKDKILIALETILLIAQGDESPSYDAVSLVQDVKEMIAQLDAS